MSLPSNCAGHFEGRGFIETQPLGFLQTICRVVFPHTIANSEVDHEESYQLFLYCSVSSVVGLWAQEAAPIENPAVRCRCYTPVHSERFLKKPLAPEFEKSSGLTYQGEGQGFPGGQPK